MLNFLRSLRRPPGDHRDVFAEFAVMIVFVVAGQWAGRKDEAGRRI
jgi:hypothetical protein